MRHLLPLLATAALFPPACSAVGEGSEANRVVPTSSANERPAVEREASAPANAAVPANPTARPAGVQRDRTASAPKPASFPVALRGEWRETDGPVPTTAQCDRSDYGNAGRILSVEAERFGYFEQGGRLLQVKERSAGRLRAVFDTSYAEPDRDELVFVVDPVARTLTVTDMARGPASRTFKRCP